MRRLALSLCLAVCAAAAGEPAAITFDDLELLPDSGWIAPVAASLDAVGAAGEEDMRVEFDALMAKYRVWEPARTGAVPDQVFQALNAVAMHDMGRGRTEAEFAHAVFRDLRQRHGAAALRPALEAIVRGGDGRTAATAIPALGLETHAAADELRHRVSLYAKKLLARVAGVVADATAPAP